jgi:predicted nuclease of predicted toxin-antitoxin system
VKFLVDQNRSPVLAERLRDAGHDAVHTMELGLERAEDDELLLLAREEQCEGFPVILISARYWRWRTRLRRQ